MSEEENLSESRSGWESSQTVGTKEYTKAK